MLTARNRLKSAPNGCNSRDNKNSDFTIIFYASKVFKTLEAYFYLIEKASLSGNALMLNVFIMSYFIPAM
jgi:hypothetical protein